MKFLSTLFLENTFGQILLLIPILAPSNTFIANERIKADGDGSIKSWLGDIKTNPQYLAVFQVCPYFLTVCHICQPLPLIV